jgi:hypothetical protein
MILNRGDKARLDSGGLREYRRHFPSTRSGPTCTIRRCQSQEPLSCNSCGAPIYYGELYGAGPNSESFHLSHLESINVPVDKPINSDAPPRIPCSRFPLA